MLFNAWLDSNVAVAMERLCLISETLGVATIGVNLLDEVTGLEPTDPVAREELDK